MIVVVYVDDGRVRIEVEVVLYGDLVAHAAA